MGQQHRCLAAVLHSVVGDMGNHLPEDIRIIWQIFVVERSLQILATQRAEVGAHRGFVLLPARGERRGIRDVGGLTGVGFRRPPQAFRQPCSVPSMRANGSRRPQVPIGGGPAHCSGVTCAA
jgi:hypothetical protein